MKIVLLVLLAFVAVARAKAGGGAIIGVLGAGQAVNDQLNRLLDNLGDTQSCNAAGCCIWNDWMSRDQQARIQKVFDNCRFSKEKRTFGFVNGRYYCYYTPTACTQFGNSLD